MPGMLTSEEAARRLGVKLTTIYAYVSRGLLVSHRSGDGRRSLFDVAAVEALARRNRPTYRPEGRLATVATSVTELRAEGPAYRGRLAVDLAATEPFEAVAELLWQVGPGPWHGAPTGPTPVRSIGDRLRWAVVMSGSLDELRSDLRVASVAHAARTIVSTMVAALGDYPCPGDEPIAQRLACQLSGEPSDELVDAVRVALVLLADHELATSTVSVRVAASTRSDVYDAVLSGLGTVMGPLHGGASRQAHLLLEDVERHGSAAALDDALRWQGRVPGFGHFLYQEADPRFVALIPFVERCGAKDRCEVVESLLALARERGLPAPNVDLGLAALTFSSGMDVEAGGALFKVSRVAGWVAHYLEELTESPLRYRARAVYVTR
jgi:citrate synthase